MRSFLSLICASLSAFANYNDQTFAYPHYFIKHVSASEVRLDCSIASQPAVGGIFYDADGKAATVELVPRAPYGTGNHPAIESFFYTLDNSWPQIGMCPNWLLTCLRVLCLLRGVKELCSNSIIVVGASGTTVQPTKFIPPNILSNATIRVTRTTALNVRYKFAGLFESMTMTLIVPIPVQPVGY